MAYRSNDNGCGCIIVFFVICAVISGIRSCTEHLIKGDIKLPKSGSSRVSGGSGGYGTSNGYNVKYKNTTSPNYNSSNNTYEYTNSAPTEYKDGSNRSKDYSTKQSTNSSISHQSVNSSSISTSSTSNNVASSPSSITCPNCGGFGFESSNNSVITCTTCNGKGTIKYKKCNYCDGKGYTVTMFKIFEEGESCGMCNRGDRHVHENVKVECIFCSGTGRDSF
jgi:DnaJ-class molecular chaperone